MTIKQAIEQIDNRTQEIPSNWHAGKGLSDGVTWSEVREWLASLTATENATLAGVWQSAYSYGVDDERTSQANPGIAGCFCNTSPCRCFIDPARVNPYRPTQ